ncbi:hypothetical protein CLAFUW4_07256 [Fulvia fulva]|uniref:Uncharacterized protein n=1 Tax=Passalora fulva TaxID=5499 RepID=A0A9Q8PBA9_PASFU|nr:uncharacterized protein CLAFUR5_07386 [Fulvia fulva]KAK4621479.1 hypothetical protein CLAFUR4_07264 [Fulvia fulva]KAK4623249.1 hypothetical protein CLAFUR0_07261 [Fulvia fulva]UJO19325.1 hypothetical protein CLAFUR5_07386 [Fulvia fulva]WPV16680.1 hypothetical protein CLAFUW4_07256 [Fulvia fulva]WPV31244.1 hypothetical protein CLAFUW7_07257 [Fulvia fulva]
MSLLIEWIRSLPDEHRGRVQCIHLDVKPERCAGPEEAYDGAQLAQDRASSVLEYCLPRRVPNGVLSINAWTLAADGQWRMVWLPTQMPLDDMWQVFIGTDSHTDLDEKQRS